MSAAAFDRARKLGLGGRGGAPVAHALGVVHALLILAAAGVWAALTVLIVTRGDTWTAAGAPDGASAAGVQPSAELDDGRKFFTGTGLFPIVATNVGVPNLAHRATGRFFANLIRRIPRLATNAGALPALMAAGLTASFLIFLVAQVRRARIAELAQDVATAIRRQIHRQVYRLGQSSLPSEGTGPVMSLFTREVNDVRDALVAELDGEYRLPVLVAGLLLLALGVSWPSTLVLAAVGLAAWGTVRSLNRSAELASIAATRDSALQLTLLQEDFSLIRTVRVHGMEQFDKQRFDDHLDRYRQADIRRMLDENRTNPTSRLVLGAAATLAIGFLAYRVSTGAQSPAATIVVVAALAGLYRPVLGWLARRRAIEQAERSAEGIFEYLEQRPELHQAGGASFLRPITQRINFENVSLTDGSGRTLLDGLTVEIPARSRTAIMGADEEAKTALACLIPRLIDPTVGRVRVDGLDLREVTLESIRAQVALVLQADLVFSDSVQANIALGDPSYPLARVIEAAKVAHAHHFIQDLPDGYDTIVGDLGEYLKPDQKYRIALARAYLHDPSIVIVEEPDYPLDDDVKGYIDDTIARLAVGRTLIILPHRLSTIRSSDQVILLNNGRLEAIGTPAEIRGESRLYRHLQYLEFNEFAASEAEANSVGA